MQQLFIDTHAHFYPVASQRAAAFESSQTVAAQNEVKSLLTSALNNMNCLAPAALKVICFTDWGNSQGFEALRSLEHSSLANGDPFNVVVLDERLLLINFAGAKPDSEESGASNQLVVLAGAQLKSCEGLEVLALGICHTMLEEMFGDTSTSNPPAQQLIEGVNRAGGLAVVPWSFGKWWFKRGKLVRDLVKMGAIEFVGSIPFRSTSEPLSLLVSRDINRSDSSLQELAGSDPLPLLGEGALVGSFGSLLTSIDVPVRNDLLTSEKILKLLKDPAVKKVSLGDRNSFVQAARRYWALRGSRV